MRFELIDRYPPGMKKYADRYLLSVVYDEAELRSFGIQDDDIDFDELYFGKDELSKLQLLWTDTLYLNDFYDQNIHFFQHSKNIIEY